VKTRPSYTKIKEMGKRWGVEGWGESGQSRPKGKKANEGRSGEWTPVVPRRQIKKEGEGNQNGERKRVHRGGVGQGAGSLRAPRGEKNKKHRSMGLSVDGGKGHGNEIGEQRISTCD